MFYLEDWDHYEEIIDRLVDEYEEDLLEDPAVAIDIATGVLAGTTVVKSTPTIYHSASVWGEAVEVTDGEALNPYEVIMYSQAEILPRRHENSSTEELAAACITRDLAAERRSRRGNQEN
jgi:hypothetical protein